MPITEHSQVAFAVYLSQMVRAGTCLWAIRFYQLQAGLPDPTPPPKLSYILKRIQRKSPGQSRSQSLPITPLLLTQIHTLWSQQPVSYDKTMLWAAFCLGFFGFMILCPVSAVLAYLAVCPLIPGPLFIFQDGIHLSRDRLVTHMQDTLSQLGVDVTKF